MKVIIFIKMFWSQGVGGWRAGAGGVSKPVYQRATLVPTLAAHIFGALTSLFLALLMLWPLSSSSDSNLVSLACCKASKACSQHVKSSFKIR